MCVIEVLVVSVYLCFPVIGTKAWLQISHFCLTAKISGKTIHTYVTFGVEK